MSTLPAVPEIHDSRHELDDGPMARESVVIMFQSPDDGIAAGVYTWVNSSSEAGYGVTVFGAGADGSAVSQNDDHVAVPRDLDFDAWSFGPLDWRNLETHRTMQVAFTGDRIQLDLHFEAMHEPFLYSAAPAGCPQYLAHDRIEQSGRINGTVTVDGRTWQIAGMGHRDHSWGTRDWHIMQHYKWIEAQTQDTAVHLMEINALGARSVYGYVYKDGELHPVQSAEFSVDYDDQWFSERVSIEIVDTAGRATELHGTEFTRVELPVNPKATLVDTPMRVTIDGADGVGYADFSWPPDYLAHAREHAGAQSVG